MTEMMQVIAEREGLRTPTRKRSPKELEKIVTNFKTKRAAKKKASPVKKDKLNKSLKDRQKAVVGKATAKATVVTRIPSAAVEPIPMNHISPTGYVREAAFDHKTNMFHVAFGKSTWAVPSTPEVWKTFEKAVADPNTDIDAHYRQAFRGRTGEMVAVRKGAA